MMMKKESIGSEKARDGPLRHHGPDVRVVTSAKKCLPSVESSTKSTDENPAGSNSGSTDRGERNEPAHTENNLSKEVRRNLPQNVDHHDSSLPNSSSELLSAGSERPMTTSLTTTESEENGEQKAEQPPMIPPTPHNTLSSDHNLHMNTSFEEFINSPKGQNAIMERSPEGRYVRFLEKLGSGASKDVYRAYDTQEGIEVAWNVVQLSGVPKLERNRLVNEVRLLERLHHPNIISFHGSWVNRERQEVNFVTEILSSGTLSKFIAKVQVIRWKIAKRWATQILKGLEYLHSQDPPVIHRDLKCENIFINGTSGDLRIGDLGLSTVHSTGKVLSVLGTPEFMAPDLYEESAYDEKVDIYAFGMCLLEILTKETPYRECSNPAQIYKKVMKGERPESLQRLRSEIARDFITLCLGYQDEASGNYIRPTASELLKHQFLFKSDNDDAVVIVEPPLHERTIVESPRVSSHKSAAEEDLPLDEVPLPISRRKSSSIAECVSDHFDEMPDSEVNMKKVKVLMGRNKELKEDDEEKLPDIQVAFNDPSRTAATSVSSFATADTGFQQEIQQQPPSSQHVEPTEGISILPSQTVPTNDTSVAPQFVNSQAATHRAQTSNAVPMSLSVTSNASNQLQQFLVSASVVEDVSAAMPHYQDDILKLIVTLPVDGQTHNVQFDFHLVEDDPVEVAREMVIELGIPQEAILEIGGTISALARGARIKQGHHRKQVVTPTAPINSTHEHHHASSMYQSQQPSQVVHPQHTQSINTSSPPIPATSESPMYQSHQSPQLLQSQHPHNVATVTVPTLENHVANPNNQAEQSSQFVQTQSNPSATKIPPTTHENHTSNSTFQTQRTSSQLLHGSGNTPLQRQLSSVTPPPPLISITGQDYIQTNSLTSLQPIAVENPAPLSQQANSSIQVFPQSVQQQTDQVALPEMNTEAVESLEPITDNQSGCLPNHVRMPTMDKDVSEPILSDPLSDNQNMRLINVEVAENDDDDDSMHEELKRLNQDFHKDLMRAEKVHDIRMDNLRRAKLEKEQRHMQTLEKHEKEKMQFEKRVQQEAMEQSKRLEKIQLKYASEREKLVQKTTQGSSQSSSPTQDISDQNPSNSTI